LWSSPTSPLGPAQAFIDRSEREFCSGKWPGIDRLDHISDWCINFAGAAREDEIDSALAVLMTINLSNGLTDDSLRIF
jgi:hypothetical protein